MMTRTLILTAVALLNMTIATAQDIDNTSTSATLDSSGVTSPVLSPDTESSPLEVTAVDEDETTSTITAPEQNIEAETARVEAPAVSSEESTGTVAAPGSPVAESTQGETQSESAESTTSTIETAVTAPSNEAESVADVQTTAPAEPTANDAGTSITTPEGVIYQVLKPGTGSQESSTNTLLLHYTLFLPNGQKVESSRDAEFPVPLKLQRNMDSFIKGFEIGTQGMRVGEIRRMYIPSELGYGEKGNEAIPPNTPLIFEAELVDLK